MTSATSTRNRTHSYPQRQGVSARKATPSNPSAAQAARSGAIGKSDPGHWKADLAARVEALETAVAAVYEILERQGREPKIVGTAPTARLVG